MKCTFQQEPLPAAEELLWKNLFGIITDMRASVRQSQLIILLWFKYIRKAIPPESP